MGMEDTKNELSLNHTRQHWSVTSDCWSPSMSTVYGFWPAGSCAYSYTKGHCCTQISASLIYIVVEVFNILLSRYSRGCFLFSYNFVRMVHIKVHQFYADCAKKVGWDSVVGIVTCYGLDGQGIESWWGARFSATIQTSPGSHPGSCTVDTSSLSWG
jgi:hypothetical protein